MAKTQTKEIVTVPEEVQATAQLIAASGPDPEGVVEDLISDYVEKGDDSYVSHFIRISRVLVGPNC